MKKQVLFIFNPVAGMSQIRPYMVDILEALSRDDVDLICYPTKKAGDARRIMRERTQDYDLIVCAGGDGTLDEVVNGMMECGNRPHIPIGYIPAGSTNDFAASLGIPTNMPEAAQKIANGKVKCVDLGRLHGTLVKDGEASYFVYVAAFGAFTETSYGTPQDLKNVLGHSAYILQGMQELGNLQTYHLLVETDKLTISDEFVFGMISNSKSVGGFANITGGKVKMDDGLFEVTLVKMPRNLIEVSDIITYLTQGSNHSELVYQFKTSKITLESQETIQWTLDGEYGGAYNRIEVSNLRKQLQIVK